MKKRIVYHATLVVILLMLLIPAQAVLAGMEGPTASPPGGVTMTDTDPGNGEQWGRVGGRTLSFSDLDTAQFVELLWGPENLSAVQISFDGAIDEPGETLTYTGTMTGSPEIYVWEGETKVELVPVTGHPGGLVAVPTRFLLSVTNCIGDPVILDTVGTPTGLPMVDVMALTPDIAGLFFNAQLEMQAMNPVDSYADDFPVADRVPVGTYGPALDVYDGLNTVPDAELALTRFNWGFYYELAETGMTLEEHDAHIAGLIDTLQNTTDDTSSKVGYLFDDWQLSIPGLRDDHANINNSIFALDGKLDAQGTTLGSIDSNTQGLSSEMGNLSNQMNEVYQKQQEISETVNQLPNLQLLLLLFGIEADEVGLPEDPNLPPFEFVEQVSDLYQNIDSFFDVFTELSTDVDEANASLVALDTKTDGLDAKVDELGTKMDLIIQMLEDMPFNNGKGQNK